MTIIKTGQSYRLNQLSGYETLKSRDNDYHFVYKVNNQLFDVYGRNQLMPVAKGNADIIMITSIWDHVQRTHQDSLDLEEKINC